MWRFNEDGCGVWGVLISVHSNSKKVRLGCSWTYAGQTLYVDFGGDEVFVSMGLDI